MSIARSLPSPRVARARRAAARAALLGLALASLVGTTACSSACDPCRPRGCAPMPACQPPPPPMPPMPPPLPMAPVPPQAPPPPTVGITAATDPQTIPEACRPFVSPPKTKLRPDVATKRTSAFGVSQLDMGGFVLWQVQANVWREVGWVFRDGPQDPSEHFVYKANFDFASCTNPNLGMAWYMAFECRAPLIQSLSDFLPWVRNENGGNYLGLTYHIHALSDGAFP